MVTMPTTAGQQFVSVLRVFAEKGRADAWEEQGQEEQYATDYNLPKISLSPRSPAKGTHSTPVSVVDVGQDDPTDSESDSDSNSNSNSESESDNDNNSDRVNESGADSAGESLHEVRVLRYMSNRNQLEAKRLR
jgi:hypothetical protein